MANGLLTACYDSHTQFEEGTDYRTVMPQFQKKAMEQNQKLLQWIQKLAKEKEATPAQISLAWMLCKKPWIVPIPGTTHIGRMKENGGASDIALTKEEVQHIDDTLDQIDMSAVFSGTPVQNR